MAKKRESRQKSRQSVAIRGGKKPAKGDRDIAQTAIRVLAERVAVARSHSEIIWRMKQWAWTTKHGEAAAEVLAILNGTERKGGKR